MKKRRAFVALSRVFDPAVCASPVYSQISTSEYLFTRFEKCGLHHHGDVPSDGSWQGNLMEDPVLGQGVIRPDCVKVALLPVISADQVEGVTLSDNCSPLN